jgi:hypothetical protein
MRMMLIIWRLQMETPANLIVLAQNLRREVQYVCRMDSTVVFGDKNILKRGFHKGIPCMLRWGQDVQWNSPAHLEAQDVSKEHNPPKERLAIDFILCWAPHF